MGEKKALFVINTLGHAGAEMALLELLTQLLGTGFELHLYVMLAQGELVRSVPPGVILENKTFCGESVLSKKGRMQLAKKVTCLSMSHGALIRNLSYLVKNAWEMAKNGRVMPEKLLWRVVSDGADLIEEEYDLAVAFLEGASTYYVADRIRAKKKAAFIHIDYKKAGYTRALDKDCYSRFDRIFPISGEVKAAFLSVYPECAQGACVFSNLLDEKRIFSLSREGDVFDDGFAGYRIVTVGRLVPQKGYDLAIKVMRLLKEERVPVRWYVLGEGPLHKQLKKQIAHADLNDDFILEGAKENPYPYIARADLYVNLSSFEGKSIAIQEAQILGTVVLAADSNGNREQITNGEDGVLCKADPRSACDAIMQLLKNPLLCRAYAKAAQKRYSDGSSQIGLLRELVGLPEMKHRVECGGVA